MTRATPKATAVAAALDELRALRAEKGIDYPNLWADLSRLSTGALTDFVNLIRFLKRT